MSIAIEELGPVDAIIDRALAEDLHAGDVTSRATVPATATARARLIAREPLVFCGGSVAAAVFRRVDPSAVVITEVVMNFLDLAIMVEVIIEIM